MTSTILRACSFMGISFWLVSFSYAQLSEARKDIVSRYPNSCYFIQSTEPHLVRFNFVHKEQACCAIYSVEGDWLGTITKIPAEQLPTSIRKEVSKLSHQSVKAAYQINSCFTYGPVFTSFIETPTYVDANSPFPSFAVAGVTVWVSSIETHQGFLVDRNGISHLNPSDSQFIGLLHHPSGRGLASQEVAELLEAFLIPFPHELIPSAYSLQHTVGSLQGWHPSFAWQ